MAHPASCPVVHLELGFLRHDHDFPVDLGAQKARHWAESAARAYEQAGLYLSVDDPAAVGAVQLLELHSLIAAWRRIASANNRQTHNGGYRS